tara:strand:- start:256 stop:414 length:159 start_codon:yes stop_codon:yes gene_type:complete
MSKPTEKELQAELEQLQINYKQAVQIQNNCERRAIEITAILNYLQPEEEEDN